MGTDALATSGITSKVIFLLRDRRLSDPSDPLYKVRKSRLIMFLALEFAGFGATMAITQTVGKWLLFLSYTPLTFALAARLFFLNHSGDWVSCDNRASNPTTRVYHPATSLHGRRIVDSRWARCFTIRQFPSFFLPPTRAMLVD